MCAFIYMHKFDNRNLIFHGCSCSSVPPIRACDDGEVQEETYAAGRPVVASGTVRNSPSFGVISPNVAVDSGSTLCKAQDAQAEGVHLATLGLLPSQSSTAISPRPAQKLQRLVQQLRLLIRA
jgi:hypothetical protein